MKKTSSEFFICDCYSEGILVTKYKNEDEFYFSFFKRGYAGNKLSWKDKLRYILQIIKTGIPFEDEVILNKTKIASLVKFLSKKN
jgi:hypothetical protein